MDTKLIFCVSKWNSILWRSLLSLFDPYLLQEKNGNKCPNCLKKRERHHISVSRWAWTKWALKEYDLKTRENDIVTIGLSRIRCRFVYHDTLQGTKSSMSLGGSNLMTYCTSCVLWKSNFTCILYRRTRHLKYVSSVNIKCVWRAALFIVQSSCLRPLEAKGPMSIIAQCTWPT